MHAPYQEELTSVVHECMPYGWRYLTKGETVCLADLVFYKCPSDDFHGSVYEVPIKDGMLGRTATDDEGHLELTLFWRAIRRVG